MTVHSFYVVGLREGFPLYSRKWTKSMVDTSLLSGFMASIEHMAQQVTSEHVNVVNLQNRRFFFQIDESNGLLLIFITDTSESTARFRKYLRILNQRFVEMFKETLKKIRMKGTSDTNLFRNFDEFVDDLVLSFWLGETTLSAAKVMDVLEVFTLFYNTLLQRFLTEKTRNTEQKRIQSIFQKAVEDNSDLEGLRVTVDGVVYYDAIDPQQVKYRKLRNNLFNIFQGLIQIVRESTSTRTYQSLVFKHLSPLFRDEQERLKAYSLTENLVMEIL